MTHSASDPWYAVIDSASTYSIWAAAFSWTSGWYSDCRRDVSM